VEKLCRADACSAHSSGAEICKVQARLYPASSAGAAAAWKSRAQHNTGCGALADEELHEWAAARGGTRRATLSTALRVCLLASGCATWCSVRYGYS
jgi:hypothetical protein